jgi:AcrR family transcriptional regulator
MARIVKEEEYASKRNQILDTAQRLVYAKGYERMTLQDIQDELHISSGAFYHYFANKQKVLEALADRMQAEMEQLVLPIVRDDQLPADEKLRNFLAAILRREISPEALTLMIALLRIWFGDSNALIRYKVDAGRMQRLAPLLTEIVQQGIGEQRFTPVSPGLAGEVALSLIQGLEYSMARVHARFEKHRDEHQYLEELSAVYDAYMESIERAFGVRPGLLYRLDPAAVEEALRVYKKGEE